MRRDVFFLKHAWKKKMVYFYSSSFISDDLSTKHNPFINIHDKLTHKRWQRDEKDQFFPFSNSCLKTVVFFFYYAKWSFEFYEPSHTFFFINKRMDNK